MKKNSYRIAMLGHKHMLSREGGVEVVVKELSTRMAAKGHRVTCYDRCSRHISGGEIENRKEYKGVQIVPVWTIERRGLAAFTSSLSAAWKAARSDADIVHIHAEGPAAMCWIPRLFGKRVIVTIHGLDWKRAKWGGVASRYIRFGERIAVKQADEIIVLSKNMQDYFFSAYGRKTALIPNGVNTSVRRFPEEIKKKWSLEKDSYILFLGRIVPEKGLKYLLDAWKEIRAEKKLVIAGGSSDTQEYLNELKKRADERVIFTGFQQGKVLEELYSNCYLFVLPSDLEGMPLSLLEAMSYGNCCLVSDISECTDVVGENAEIFRHGNTEDLKRKIKMLLEDKSRVMNYRKMTADYITRKYNWDDVVEKTLRLYASKERPSVEE